MSLTGNWSYPTAIKFGAGRIAELPDACAQTGMKRPLLVTDRGLRDLPITKATLDIMEAAGLGRAIFADVDPNPNETNLAAGLEVYKAGGHDGVIAFGGGSGLDLGKMVAFMSGQTRPVWDYEDIGDWWTRADPAGIAPIIAVPTTAGTPPAPPSSPPPSAAARASSPFEYTAPTLGACERVTCGCAFWQRAASGGGAAMAARTACPYASCAW